MPKIRTKFVCQNCGYQNPKHMGRCPNCGEFNTMVEVTEEVRSAATKKQDRQLVNTLRAQATRLHEVSGELGERHFIPVEEFNRVMGGGLVPGSLTLIGGDPGIGKCLTGDTRVLDPTTGDFLPIVEWQDRELQVLSLDETTHKAAPDKVIAFHKQGKKPVFVLETKLGYRLRCTANHPLLTHEGWKPLENFAAGDLIGVVRNLPHFGTESMSETKIKLIAYVLGDGSAGSQVTITSMLPDVEEDVFEIATAFNTQVKIYEKPNNRAKQYRFSMDREQLKIRRIELRQRFVQIMKMIKEEKGISWVEWARQSNINSGTMYAYKKGQIVPTQQVLARMAQGVNIPLERLEPELCLEADQTSSIMTYLDDIGIRFKTAATKFVPSCIFRLSKAQLALFLKILFSCDGSVYYKNQVGISYSTISRKLAEDIQHLLLRFGFISKLRTKHSLVNQKPYVAYEIQLLGVPEVKRFLKEIGIYGRDEAKERIANELDPILPSTHRDIIPTGSLFFSHIITVAKTNNFAEISRTIGTKFKNRRHDRPLTRYLVQKPANAYPDERLSALAYGDVYWDEIVSIEPDGEEEVYDLSIQNQHNFVANNIFVHNSTLMAQISGVLANSLGRVLYVSGEESARQIKMRADRLGIQAEDLFLLTETNLGNIFEQVQQVNPEVLIIDSIQTVYAEELDSSPGLVSQVRECATRLQTLAKSTGVSVFLIGHVTKEGTIAGPRVLEHIVDTVLYLEGDPFQAFRLLRSVKNRFGATSEVGVFEMQGAGMVEVPNPSEAFLAERVINAPGSSIAVTMEGTRPLLVEIQALTSVTSFGNPRRTPNGVDVNRLLLISAVLNKRVGLRLHDQDIFINVVGGLKVTEPASDLAMAMAMASSYYDKPVPADLVVIGEIGLSGEVRAVSQLAMRLNEASKIGFKRALVPKMRRQIDGIPDGLQVLTARNLADALAIAVPR